MKKEMLINVLQPEEIRIAILEDGVLEELYVERTSHESYVGNIYKGRIVNIEPSIQAAFVDFGVGRNGFLHVSDVEPAYYRHLENEHGGRRSPRDRGRSGDRGPKRSRRVYEEEPRPQVPAPPDVEEKVHETPLADLPEYDPDRYEEPGRYVEPAEDESPLEEGVKDWPSAESDEKSTHGVDGITATEDISVIGDYQGAPQHGAAPTDTDETHQAAEPAEGPRRGRRRGRGRNRRGREEQRAEPQRTEPEAHTTDEAGDASSTSASEPESPETGAPPREWPRLMESAEHRTREDDEPHEPIEPRPLVSDEELSFSMAPDRAAVPARSGSPNRGAAPAESRSDASATVEEPPHAPETFWEKDRDVEAERAQEEFVPIDEPAPVADYDEPREHAFADERVEERPADLGREYEEEAPRQRRPQRGFERRDDRRGGRRDDRRGGPRRFPGRMGLGRPKPLIQDIFKRGQEVLVQVIKEGIGTKGPTLSTYISIAGRYLVLMPGLQRIGVSRKIVDEEARRRLREILHELQPPRGLGFIIRTAGIDRNKRELQRDLAYLSRLWEVVVRRIQKIKSPAEIYQESDMITRTIRDIFTSEIDTIWVDEKNAYEHAREFLQIVLPRYADRIKFYDSTEPMFHRHGIENEIAKIQQRHIPLPAGGSIVIDQTEALVAIDVNSGNFRADNNAEETAYQMNLQAAKEIARQLRLRDLGGVIVNDFIDMREEKHRRGVEKALREAVRRDRARTKILKISQFGIVEMTRQRIRPSLKRSVFQDCAHCRGTGQVKTVESMSIEVMRLVQLAAHRDNVVRIEVRVQDEVAAYLLNRKRKEIAQLEESDGKQIFVRGQPGESPEFLEFICYDNNSNEVKFLPFDPAQPGTAGIGGDARHGPHFVYREPAGPVGIVGRNLSALAGG